MIGSGNVGYHLAVQIGNAGHQVIEVYSRNLQKAQSLAKLVHARAFNDLTQINHQSDIYLLAVRDDAIESCFHAIQEFIPKVAIIAHCSGQKSIDILDNPFTSYGVFYPFQTLTRNRSIDFFNVPLLIEGNNKKSLKRLLALGNSINNNAFTMSSRDRSKLHLAATIANNFSNHMYTLAKRITDMHGLDFELLKPLILETALKVQEIDPITAQTGAAIRDDRTTMKHHLEMLVANPSLQQLYKILSKSINPGIATDDSNSDSCTN
jgi:predicted short-subunit dehydrogenase-like oxidoreductase (DUF2520 family)